MGRHVVGKWGRGEGLERKSAKARAGGTAEKRPSWVARSYCFICGEEHRFEEPCSGLSEYLARLAG